MSGLEVAGVVLGSIPLLVVALEHYIEGLSTISKWRRYQRELQSLIRNLETERVKLQNVCEKLLVGLVPPSRIESMINDPLGSLWKEDETQRKIRTRLWKGLDVFEATIGDVNVAVEEMGRRIDSQRGGAVSEIRKVVFTIKRSQYADLLLTIKDGISNMESLTDQSIVLEPARKVRSHGRALMILRDMSKGLYRALKSSLGCACEHDVGLRLERRSAKFGPSDDDAKIMSDMAFKVAVSYNTTSGHHEGTPEYCRTWEEIRIKPTATVSTKPLSTEKLVTPTQRIRGRAKKSVRFSSHSEAASSTTTLVQTEIQSPSTDLHKSIPSLAMDMASIGLLNLGITLDLCQRIQMAQKQAQVECYGMITDSVPCASSKEYGVYPTLNSEFEDDGRDWAIISLWEVLDQKDDSLHLPYRDRLQLAVVISSSVLQLHGSPWLPDILTSRDIFFIKKQGYPIYNHPFIMRSLPGNDPGPGYGEPSVPIQCNPTLLSLGILLIELILGKTFESLRSPQGSLLTSPNLLLDHMTAQRQVEKVRMASSNYGTAVMRCIGGELHKDGGNLDTEEFCHDVYSGVVALLEKDLENS